MTSRHWTLQAGLWAAGLIIANALILWNDSLLLKAIAAILLYSVLPGLAVIVALFPSDTDLDWWERVAFSLGAGIMLSTLATWIYALVPGRITLSVLLVILDALALALALVAARRLRGSTSPLRLTSRLSRRTAVTLAILALGALVCFLWLDYTEYDSDETAVLSSALASLEGNDGAVYRLAKGPAQILVATAFMLMGDSVSEELLRVPFALASWASALAFWILARRLLRTPAAWAALTCLVLEGFFVTSSHWIQFRALVYLNELLAVACLLLSERARSRSLQTRLQLLGSAFFAFGVFSHFGGAFVAPALALLWLWTERDHLRERATWLRAGALALVIGLIAGTFYLLLILQPAIGDKLGEYYLGYRVGRGPFNMLPDFFTGLRLYESPAWIVVVLAGLLMASIVIGIHLLSRHRLLGTIFWLALAGAILAAVMPDALTLADLNLSFVPFGILIGCLLAASDLDITLRLLGVWALGAFFIPGFWMQVPGNHYYPAIPPLILLAVLGWHKAIVFWDGRITNRQARLWFQAGLVTATAILIVAGTGYTYLILLSHDPEYGTLYPDNMPRPFVLFEGEPPPVSYGIPHQNGWRAVMALFDQGVLRGEFQTNEITAISDWYRATKWKPPAPQPRYYFLLPHPYAPALASEPPPDLQQTHWLLGRITVGGQTRMLIYQQREDGPPPQPRTWAVEDFTPQWRQLSALSRFVAYKDNQRDDTEFYALARTLETLARPADTVIFGSPLARGLLTQFYQGDLSLDTAAVTTESSVAQRVWGIYWASPDNAVERSMAQNACPAMSQWFGNVRLVLNGVGTFTTPIDIGARLGSVAVLRAVALDSDQPHAGDVMCIRLDWQVLAPTNERHKVFLHMVGPSGTVLAQTDTEPLAGFKPTTEWTAGESFADHMGLAIPDDVAPGSYRLLAGLYNGRSGVLQPALASSGTRYPGDAVELGSVTIQ